jgi:hypothetical protein
MERIVNSEILKWITDGLNFNVKELNQRKAIIVKMQTSLYMIQSKELDRIGESIEIAAKINSFICESLKSKQIFEEGRSFSYLINQLQLKSLAQSTEDSWLIKDKAVVYQTDKRMYYINQKYVIEPQNYIRKLHFNKIAAANFIKVTDEEGTE